MSETVNPAKMKEEALKRGGDLLKSQPDLKDKTEMNWSEKGAGRNLMMLCELLKGNAIPMKNMVLKGEKSDERR